jgi:hypothetical protein
MNGRNTENAKARPFENLEGSATRKFKVKGYGKKHLVLKAPRADSHRELNWLLAGLGPDYSLFVRGDRC